MSRAMIRNGTLYWMAKVKPSPLSRVYNLEITYRLKESPKVYVVGEGLCKLDDPDFPHNYGIDYLGNKVSICLCKAWEFSSSQLLSTTMVVWAIEWLYYYEIWLFTGEWKGGGEHPKNKEE